MDELKTIPSDSESEMRNSSLDTNLFGMSPPEAKEYILNFISTLKLTEKQILSLDDEIIKWQSRIDLAASKGQPDLAMDAEKEKNRLLEKQSALRAEAEQLKLQIEEMRKQLPMLSSCERNIDNDLLEQEMFMAAGYMPGDEEKVRAGRRFKEMEKEQAADAALEELKAKMQR